MKLYIQKGVMEGKKKPQRLIRNHTWIINDVRTIHIVTHTQTCFWNYPKTIF